MTRISHLGLACALAFAGCGGPEFGLEKATGPLGGTFNGKSWSMAAGEARAMTGGQMMISIWSSPTHKSCEVSGGTYDPDERMVMFSVPIALGTYALPDSAKGYGAFGYAYYLSGTWTNVTDLTHVAAVKISSLQNAVEGAVAYDAGSTMQLYGTFSVPVCTFP